MCNCPENNTNPCPDGSTNKIVVKWSDIINKPDCFTPCLNDLNLVLQSRTLSINGITYDLSQNRSWTINSGVSNLSELDDVNVNTPMSGNVLIFNGSVWVNETLEGSKWTATGSNIFRNSNVAIGTTEISGRLHVSGNLHLSGGNVNVFNVTNNNLSLGTNNLERIRIENTGIVGIGINYNHIGSNSTTDRLLLGVNTVAPNNVNYDILRLITNPLSAQPKYVGINFEVATSSSIFGLAAIRAFDMGVFKGDLTFWTDPGINNISYVERMRITSEGIVGIGTSSPSLASRLHVIGSGIFSENLTVSNSLLVGSSINVNGGLTVSGPTTLNNSFKLITNNTTVLDVNYVTTATDNILYFSTTAVRTLDLPDPSTNVGRIIYVYNNGSHNIITSTPTGSIVGIPNVNAGKGKVFICFSTTVWLALTTE
jgi:hypothetical protein